MALNTTPATWAALEDATSTKMNAEIRDAFTGIQSAWLAYTPTAPAGLTVGNGVWDAAYMRVGKTIHVRVKFTFGTTSSIASTITIGLPVTQKVTASGGVILAAHVLDTSAGATGRQVAIAVGVGTDVVAVYGIGGSFTATVPFTWATGDIIAFSGTYEAA